MMNNMPQGLAIIILSLHMIVFPVSIAGVQLIQPTAIQRIADRKSMEDNENTLHAIWALVESMHYERDPNSHLQWIETLETVEASTVRRALKRYRVLTGLPIHHALAAFPSVFPLSASSPLRASLAPLL